MEPSRPYIALKSIYIEDLVASEKYYIIPDIAWEKWCDSSQILYNSVCSLYKTVFERKKILIPRRWTFMKICV